jgi:hypothetical protein
VLTWSSVILGPVRITDQPLTDAAYIQLTDRPLTPGRITLGCPLPADAQGQSVMLDWKDRRIVGLEVLDASHLLHGDLLDAAELI